MIDMRAKVAKPSNVGDFFASKKKKKMTLKACTCIKKNTHIGDGQPFGTDGGVSVRGSAAAAGETLWGRLPCNPILAVRPAPLCKPILTALNCYLWQTCLPDNRQPGVLLRPGLHGVKGMRVGGWEECTTNGNEGMYWILLHRLVRGWQCTDLYLHVHCMYRACYVSLHHGNCFTVMISLYIVR